jgi:hypothetical protein
MTAGPFQATINSFHLHLSAEHKAPKTITTYTEAAQWFAGAYLRIHTDHSDWSAVVADDVRAWLVYLLERYSDSYANN